MARLDDLLPELKDDISESEKKINLSIAHVGKKRRAWLENETTGQMGSINPFDKPLYPQVISKISDIQKGSINHVSKSELCFADLRSNPLKIFRYLFELAQRSGDDYKTPRVKVGDIMLYFNMSKDSARTALRFLMKQKIIGKIEFQVGSMGWSRYQLNASICKELERGLSKGFIDPFDNRGGKVDNNFATDNFNDDPWDEIDFSGIESIGFNKKHLLQIKNKNTPEVVQESINHFGYALIHNKKIKEYSNPLVTLIAVLKRGEAWVEPDYKSPQELAQLKLLETKKAELARRKALEEEFYKVAFEEWLLSLSETDKETLAPTTRKNGDIIGTPQSVKLGAYFRENIWPGKKNEYHA